MNDIVERLRVWSPLILSGYEVPFAAITLEEAAAEIERLRARVKVLEDTTSMLIENLKTTGSFESEQEAIARARTVLGVPTPARSRPLPWETAP